ncbi:hypothetical protein Lal_00047218 [Lupinus albus]|nr:hypothetical protein Lal_00047218 [Lupinus albus]
MRLLISESNSNSSHPSMHSAIEPLHSGFAAAVGNHPNLISSPPATTVIAIKRVAQMTRKAKEYLLAIETVVPFCLFEELFDVVVTLLLLCFGPFLRSFENEMMKK